MKVELTNLGLQSKVQDYTITKKIDDFGVVTEIDSKAKFDKDNGFQTLLTETMTGSTEEEALFTVECGDDDIEIDGYVLHNEGSFNLNDCYAEKTLKFKSPIECIKNIDINIFDYTPTDTQTVQGEVRRQSYGNQLYRFIGDESYPFPSISEILSVLGGVPDRSSLGYYPEYILITVTPESNIVDNGNGGTEEQYLHHNWQLYVSYIGLFSTIQYDTLWKDNGLGEFYYTGLPVLTYNAPFYNSIQINATYYLHFGQDAGQLNKFKDVPISNTFSLNEIIQDIISCSEIQIVSNFFGIDNDFSNPDNNEYQFAIDFLQDLKIAQSYDIIRESAIQDSFGKSGIIKAKNFVLELNRILGLMLVYDSELDILRWEHYTYFESKGLDFEVQTLEYEIDDDTTVNRDVINIEKWLFAQPTPTDGFYQTAIDYQNYQLNSDVNEISKKSDIFLTDIFGCLNNPLYETDNYKKLFFLLSTDGTNVIGLNSALSIRSIVENLHYKNRPLRNGLHDNRPVIFTGYSAGLETKVSIFSNFKIFNKLNPGNSLKLNKKGKGTWLITELEIEDKKITFSIKK